MFQNPWLVDQVAKERQQQLRRESEEIRTAKTLRMTKRGDHLSGPRAPAGSLLKQASLALAELVISMLG